MAGIALAATVGVVLVGGGDSPGDGDPESEVTSPPTDASTDADADAGADSTDTTVGDEDATALELERQVVLAYGALADHLLAADRARLALEDGTGDAAAYRGVLADTDASTVTEAELDRLSGADPHPALDRYRDAAGLYRQHLAVARAGLDLTGPLGVEVEGSARRLRLLADRVYDRGRVALLGAEPAVAGVEVQRPDEVPDFAYEGLAPGAPLHEGAPPEPVSTGRSEPRPTASESAWLDAVDAAVLPAAVDLRRALTDGSSGVLVELAGRFDSAEQALRAAPDPAGAPERATVLRLALLVHAEAARVAAAASLAPAGGGVAGALAATAVELAGLGDALRAASLGGTSLAP